MFRTQTESFLQALKHQVAILGTVTVPAQGREGKRVRGVVGGIEATLDGKRRCARVAKPGAAGLDEAIELGLADRIFRQLTELGLRPNRSS